MYFDFKTNFELLKKDPSYKYSNFGSGNIQIFEWSSPSMVNEAFQVKSKNELFNRNPKPVKQGNESMLCLAPKIWLVVP